MPLDRTNREWYSNCEGKEKVFASIHINNQGLWECFWSAGRLFVLLFICHEKLLSWLCFVLVPLSTQVFHPWVCFPYMPFSFCRFLVPSMAIYLEGVFSIPGNIFWSCFFFSFSHCSVLSRKDIYCLALFSPDDVLPVIRSRLFKSSEGYHNRWLKKYELVKKY